jgi:hypothetical protein
VDGAFAIQLISANPRNAPKPFATTSTRSLTRPGISNWTISITELVETQISSTVRKESCGKEIRVKTASGTKRNRFKNLSVTPLIWMNPNNPSEFGSTGVKTIAPKEIK